MLEEGYYLVGQRWYMIARDFGHRTYRGGNLLFWSSFEISQSSIPTMTMIYWRNRKSVISAFISYLIHAYRVFNHLSVYTDFLSALPLRMSDFGWLITHFNLLSRAGPYIWVHPSQKHNPQHTHPTSPPLPSMAITSKVTDAVPDPTHLRLASSLSPPFPSWRGGRGLRRGWDMVVLPSPLQDGEGSNDSSRIGYIFAHMAVAPLCNGSAASYRFRRVNDGPVMWCGSWF
jgi:hypothetical protein